MSQDHVLRNTDVTENSVLKLIITGIYCLLACEIRDGCANSTVTYSDFEKVTLKKIEIEKNCYTLVN